MQTLRRLLLVVMLMVPVGLSMSAAPARAQTLAPVTAADRSIGRADAPVTVVEYASFACHHCADWHMLVYPAFKARFIDTGQVRLVFRNLPTPPEEMSFPAAGLARCAAPERFFDVAGALMNGQARVLRYGGNREDLFNAAIAVSGRTKPQIEACLAQAATMTAINRDIESAHAAGLDHTPSFFVNGRAVQDRSLGGLAAVITPLLAGR